MPTAFFRKNGKILLAVFTVLLMVVWVANPKGGGPERGQVVEGTLRGKSVTAEDLHRVAYLHRMITLAFPSKPPASLEDYMRQMQAQQFLQPVFAAQFNPGQSDRIGSALGQLAAYRALTSLDAQHGKLHLYLLLQEAHQNHIVASDDVVNAAMQAMFPNAEALSQYLEREQITERGLRQMLGDFDAVLRLISLAGSVPQTSLPQMLHSIARSRATVSVRYTALEAKDAAKMPEPSPQEVQAQFAAYQNQLPPSATDEPAEINGHRYPFGYKYPDRVQVEYLTIDRAAVIKTVTLSAEDIQQIYDYYKSHPEEFSELPPPGTQPAATQPKVQAFDAVKGKLIQQWKEKKADEKIKKLTEEALAQTGRSWSGPNSTGFRSLLPGKEPVRLETLAANLQKQFGVLPGYHAPGGWLDAGGLTALPGIGSATPVGLGQELAFPKLALHVRGIEEKPQGVFLALHLQEKFEGPVLYDAQKNAYIYRVTAAEKAHAPASADEVRPAVVRDLKRLAAYQAHRAAAEKAVADKASLTAFAKAQGSSVQTPPAFPEQTGGEKPDVPEVTGLGRVPAFVDAAFALAKANLTSAPPPAPAASSQPAAPLGATVVSSTQPAAAKSLAAVPVESRLAVYVLQVDAFEPLYLEQFNANRASLAEAGVLRDMDLFLKSWVNLSAVMQRVGFVPRQELSTSASAE